MHIQQIWHPEFVTMQDLLHAIHYASTESETEQALRPYVARYHTVTELTAPVKKYTGAISGGAYHHGDKFNIYAKGWPEDLLRHCIMSEGEREKATLEYLHLQSLGLTVIGFGEAEAKVNNVIPKLTFLGFLGIKN